MVLLKASIYILVGSASQSPLFMHIEQTIRSVCSSTFRLCILSDTLLDGYKLAAPRTSVDRRSLSHYYTASLLVRWLYV